MQCTINNTGIIMAYTLPGGTNGQGQKALNMKKFSGTAEDRKLKLKRFNAFIDPCTPLSKMFYHSSLIR